LPELLFKNRKLSSYVTHLHKKSCLNEGKGFFLKKRLSYSPCYRNPTFFLRFHFVFNRMACYRLTALFLFILLVLKIQGQKVIQLSLTKSRRLNKILNQRSSVHYAKMYNDEGSQYLVRVGIGNPIQNFTVALDTGR
jgi:hypothetical protein